MGTALPLVSLRPLALADAPALQTLFDAGTDSSEQATGGFPQAGQAVQNLAEAADDDARHILGIYLVDAMVGVIDFRFAEREPEAHLGLILVAESYRGRKIGRWALSILEEWLRQATPAEAVVLVVPAQSHAVQRFFHDLGYAFTGQAIRIPAGDIRSRLLFMRKKLRPTMTKYS